MSNNRPDIFKPLAEQYSLIRLNGKKPVEGWKQYQDKKRSFADIGFLPGENAGIVCGRISGIIVLDIDDPALFEITCKERNWQVPDTMTVITGRQGFHKYYKYPQNDRNYGCLQKQNLGFDIRGDGSYVVSPGSVHPDTQREYTISRETPHANAPQWLLDLALKTQSSSKSDRKDSSSIPDQNHVCPEMDKTELVRYGTECTQKLASKLDIAGNKIRPCMAITYHTHFRSGRSVIGRENALFIMATECRKIDVSLNKAISVLHRWNLDQCTPCIEHKEVERQIKNAFDRDYKYHCRSLRHFCIGFDACDHAEKVPFKNQDELDYVLKGWPRVLTPALRSLYLAIPHVERLKGVSPGGRIIMDTYHWNIYSGVAKGRIPENFNRLMEWGLIEHIPGLQHKHKKQATEIKRIIPIPYPKK
ncbi:bifunctional DNA primase/polymerase [candidate division KSB1 bacterium]